MKVLIDKVMKSSDDAVPAIEHAERNEITLELLQTPGYRALREQQQRKFLCGA